MKRLIMKSSSLLLAVIAIAILYSSCAKPDAANSENLYHDQLSKDLRNYEIFTLDQESLLAIAQTKPQTAVKINLNIPSHPDWELTMVDDDLKQYDEPGFQAIEIGANDVHTVRQEPERFALQGNLGNSERNSYLTFSLGKMEGLILDGEVEYSLQPLTNFIASAPDDIYIIFDGRDEIVEGNVCGNDEVQTEPQEATRSRGLKTIYITYLGDYQMYQKFGNYTNCSNWMYWRYYYANKRYNAYNGIDFRLVRRTMYLYSSSGSANYRPKTTSNRQTFVDECSAFSGFSWYNIGDVNYFFTGDNVEGVWGKADGISRMCSDPSQAFSFGEVATKTANGTSKTYFGQNLMAHEVGHTIAAHHDQSSNNWMHKTYTNWNTTCGTNAKNNFWWKNFWGSFCL